MNKKTVEVFHALMKNGWIDRREDAVIWSYYEELDVQEELEDFQDVLGMDLYRTGNRLYLIPTQENDLFLKNNVDYRKDIRSENTVRSRDLFLMNYLAIYIIYLFFSGEGSSPLNRDFLSREDLIACFTEHCKLAEQPREDSEETDYSENFRQLAADWLSKLDGEPSSQKFDHRYGIVNRLLVKFRADDLFVCEEDSLIRPTRKMVDLMPYFLRKDRIKEIQAWMQEGEANAENQ